MEDWGPSTMSASKIQTSRSQKGWWDYLPGAGHLYSLIHLPSTHSLNPCQV